MTMRNVSISRTSRRRAAPRTSAKAAGCTGLHRRRSDGVVQHARRDQCNGGCGGTQFFLIASTRGLLDEIGTTLPSCLVTPNPGDNIIADTLIGTLEDNGGLTRTNAYVTGSRGIDEGLDCPADDQRGFPRRIFACDIGAYEFGAENLTPDVSVFTDEKTQPGCTVDHCTLRERVETADDDD